MTSYLPVYHYLDIGRLGRGEVVYLFLKDAGIQFKEVRYPYDDTWPAASEKLREKGITRTGKVPSLEYNGLILTQHIPTLRYLARELGQYDGETSLEKYTVDAVADVYIDWRYNWVANLKGVTKEFKDEFVPWYYDVITKYYAENEGPYLLGDKITYVDFAVYQSLDNDKRIGSSPTKLSAPLQKLKEAIEARPKIAAYLKENRIAEA
ncbi:Glutathione S-transferase chloride channel C-terminal [Fusarium albosuccineum]|uniref:Glutathione S-transferase chloride channel C-terminal n=1 Tax=Fusarium albosuccineum TaxID=1237068 RepID=A0A8H4L056_9HYPO|nr:Glutathione S-transferase chloride channel C-terminal [Fusarium albosuccineum]